MKPRSLFSAVGLLLAIPLGVRAETTQCTAITALPATLSSAGVYCIDHDLVLSGSSGAAVAIAADSVTLDLNGHALRSKAAANTATVGVVVLAGHKYFTITDGTIAGFASGVNVESSGSSRAHGGLIAGLQIQRSHVQGIGVDCDGCVVRDNLVTDTVVPSSIAGFSALGIGVAGTGARVTGNRVFDTHAVPSGAQAFGISLTASNSVVAQNYVANDASSNPGEFGLLAAGSGAVVSGNQVQGLPIGFDFTNGTVKYRDNTQSGCNTGYMGSAIDLGGNN